MNRLCVHVRRVTAEEEAQRRGQARLRTLGDMDQVSRRPSLADLLADRADKPLGGARCGHGLRVAALGRLTGQHEQPGVGRDLAHDRMEEAVKLLQAVDTVDLGHVQDQCIVLGTLGGLGDHGCTGALQLTAYRRRDRGIFGGPKEHLQASQGLVCIARTRALEFNRCWQADRLDDIAQRWLAGQSQ